MWRRQRGAQRGAKGPADDALPAVTNVEALLQPGVRDVGGEDEARDGLIVGLSQKALPGDSREHEIAVVQLVHGVEGDANRDLPEVTRLLVDPHPFAVVVDDLREILAFAAKTGLNLGRRADKRPDVGDAQYAEDGEEDGDVP